MTDFPVTRKEEKMHEWEAMARMACADHGYVFLSLVEDTSNETPVPGFTYITSGQDRSAPSWVSITKSCFKRWDGSAGA